jgi:biotin/methionine sulfoxide reductase
MSLDLPDVEPVAATHWGTYHPDVREGRLVGMRPYAGDPDPSPLGHSMPGAVDGPTRIRRPMVRQSWLKHGPRRDAGGRGAEPFVAVPWDEVLELLARELTRVKERHGNSAIYAGSYGWASAGRFHHAQSQMRRFLNLFGGHTAAVHSYSYAAAQAVLPHIIGSTDGCVNGHTDWASITKHAGLVLMLGGLPAKNAQVSSGGTGRHHMRADLQAAKAKGVEFVLISPLPDDAPDFLQADWQFIRPGTDTALLLALGHVLLSEGRHDRDFLARYCAGFDRFADYLLGKTDGTPKTPDWAAAITGIPAATITALARRMAATRTMIALSWSIQRGEHGEQPYWGAIALAAMLGQIGLPGGGFGFGYSAVNGTGNTIRGFRWPSLPMGDNPLKEPIPVARISDLLLHPGEAYEFDGKRRVYPDIRLVYWVGGNPFHHHQDIGRLVRAFQRPETVVVHESYWTPLAKHADIVLPATTTLERNDLGASGRDDHLIASRRVLDPVGEARDDHAIFAALAERLGFRDAFTEGRDEEGWLRHLFAITRQRAAEDGIDMPDFDTFWRQGVFRLPAPERPTVLLEEFRADPAAKPLATPSGKIEIFSESVAGFGYDDCPGHPAWREPKEWLGAERARRFPLHLLTNQPVTRLHSQYDHGAVSLASKVQGREPIRLNPDDAAARGIKAGDVVRVYNDRGACLAGALLDAAIPSGIAQLSTGAWYDPAVPGDPDALCVHGNPNVLTPDKGTSKLGQAPSAMSCLVEVARFDGPLPPVRAFDPPAIVEA